MKQGLRFVAPVALICLAGLTMGCGAYSGEEGNSEDIDATSDELFLVWPRWANGFVPVCWDPSAKQRSDFTDLSSSVKINANNSWPAISHVFFTGWGTCPTNSNGRVRIFLNDDDDGNVSPGGYSSGYVEMNLGVERGDFYTSLVPHEFGHILGFAHEMARPDFNDVANSQCQEANVTGNYLGTTADPNSIMASTGYCNTNFGLSAQDIRGARAAYGAPDCERRIETHTDYTGKKFTLAFYCGNRGGAPLYAGTNTNTVIGYMDSTTSWFVCYNTGATHAGGNNVWYYTQGDRSSSGQSGRKGWGYMPAVNVWTDYDPYPNIPHC
jgi:hypothetical protein